MGDAREEIRRLIEDADRRSKDERQPESVRAFQAGNVAGLIQAVRTIEERTPPPHPLVALLTEALAVTDPERPPHEVQLCLDSSPDDGVSLVWHHEDRADTAIEYLPTGCRWRSMYGRPPLLSTTDPAEARAWLAAALADVEVGRG